MYRDLGYLIDWLKPGTKRTSNGRKRTTTAAAQKRAKIKRRNKKR